mmetsp:Transcript_6314/g.17624  ORF Transcript_6314/g.17624 Transcript_6314/m.17624 type:complete len:554 (-) Transcript_6314:30-1691(-)
MKAAAGNSTSGSGSGGLEAVTLPVAVSHTNAGGNQRKDASTRTRTGTRSFTGARTGQATKMGCLTAEVLSAYDLPYSEAPQCVTLTTGTSTSASTSASTSTSTSTSGLPVVTLKTGPPLARHKDRNSFRFSTPSASSSFDASASGPGPSISTGTSTGTSSTGSTGTATGTAKTNSASQAQSQSQSQSVMELVAPLPDLCKARITIRIVYANREPLETTYDLQQLRIHESKWLILNLSAPPAATATTALLPVVKDKADALERVAVTDAYTDVDTVAPTIRVKLILEGPYRPEVAAIVAIVQSWFALVDDMEQRLLQLRIGLPIPALPGELSRAMLLPVVPLMATILVASPVIAGVTMVVLPFVLPFVLLLITAIAALLVLGGFIFGSTRYGRQHFGTLLAPVTDSLLSSRAGQALIYDMGPRPSPVSLAKQVLPTSMWGKLAVSLFIDLVGSSSYLLPVVGEGLDIAWAPIQTVLIMAMYNTVTPNLKYVSFIEEILPFTDIVPTATIGFLCEFVPQVFPVLTDREQHPTVNSTPHSISLQFVGKESTPNKKIA